MAQGIRQFLHLGSGIPTNVHEQAQQQDPATRVVHVDYEAVAVHHSFELLKDNDHAAYRDACPAGSYLAISTMSQDEADAGTRERLAGLLKLYEMADERIYPRDKETIASWFAGTELVDPGLVLLHQWRPDRALGGGAAWPQHEESPARLLGYGAVGRIAG